VLKIYKYPDPILTQVCKPITKITPQLQSFAGLMMATMVENKGIGLAAPQVGKDIRLIVVDTKPVDVNGHTMVLFNPEILNKEGSCSIEEGCLSIPGEKRKVDRAAKIRVRYISILGQEVEKDFEGITAICVQHEMDHLDGILMVDYD